jgi:transposase
VQKSIAVDLALIDQVDALVIDLDLTIVREAKRHNADAFHRLRSVPGIGKVLALTILYKIHDPTRFDRVRSPRSLGWSNARNNQAGRRSAPAARSSAAERSCGPSRM